MFVLGIETSCDETSVSIIRGSDEILSNVISSSLFRHKEFGGVVPEIASRHCLEQIHVVYKQALKEARVEAKDLNLIAVTKGPGLIGSLFVGVGFAKALSYQLQIPIVGVNHLEAHLSANFFGREIPQNYIGLLVSGGHTALVHSQDSEFTIIGQTEDDAVGEAYDKVAKMMGLEYPGGPLMDKLASKGNPRAILFSKPKQKGALDFSFSGIKTAALYATKDMKTGELRADAPSKEDLAASFQHAVVKWIVDKSFAACELKKSTYLVVGGGVSANSYLRSELSKRASEKEVTLLLPDLSVTGDNGAMIARRGFEIYKKGHISDISLSAQPNLRIA